MVFFFYYLFHYGDDQLSLNFHRFVFVHNYAEIHQVRRLVFDNYQYCPLSLKGSIYAWLSLKQIEGNTNFLGKIAAGFIVYFQIVSL